MKYYLSSISFLYQILSNEEIVRASEFILYINH